MYVPLVLSEFLDRAVRLYGEKTAVIDGEISVTYRDLNSRVNQLSHGLKALTIEKGDKIAYLTPNSLEMLEGFYGVFQLGAVMTPLNTRLKAEDYEFILNHSESRVLIVDSDLFELVEPVLSNLETVETVIVTRAENLEDKYVNYEEWLSSYPETPFERAELDEMDIASLLYTSGTTGNPKGVLLTHRSNYLHALTTMHHLRVNDRDKLLHVLPMFHVNGWGSPFYYTANGCTQIMQSRVEPESIFQNLKEHNITISHMAPTVLNILLEYFAENRDSIEIVQDMRIVIAGSAPPPAFVTKVEKELNWEFIQVYGMTEISPLITISTIRSQHETLSEEEKHFIKAKAGYPMIGSNVRVATEDGVDIPYDNSTVGEIIVRTNNAMEGYFKNPEATSSSIRNGWLHTGDMAVIDENGYIEIVDRKKDVIISGGENVSSIEVESCLYDHEGVVEAAVVAAPHEKWGEVPHAFVVKREGRDITEEELITYVRDRLAHFKAPKSVSFIEALPKTASGKIQKVQLRKDLWGDSGKMVN
ncbi:long-chain-fatty-acid--CoA ligase [Alteribacillus sp. HJP-4]|uniref:long-chain-fatty-acid--CoA ligase n=1 Tax=Alteribacillus sp. HJP-4 TaxID=2775394 RepID=UPI0035CD3C7B